VDGVFRNCPHKTEHEKEGKKMSAKSMRDALWCIANMQITTETDTSEVLALCMSIARIELEKFSAEGDQEPGNNV
jgi:hypothetical protein